MYPPIFYNVQICCPFKDLAWYEINDSYPMETNLLLKKVSFNDKIQMFKYSIQLASIYLIVCCYTYVLYLHFKL
jgi:hypothetical protein